MAKMDERVYLRTVHGQLTFRFNMTDHLDPATPRNIALQMIAQWIADSYNDPIWFIEPIWIRALTGYRIAPILPMHPLYGLLDYESQRNPIANWLIFSGHPNRDLFYRVTHFGPFGGQKRNQFENELDLVKANFKILLAQYGIHSAADWAAMTKAGKAKAELDIFKEVDNHFMEIVAEKEATLAAEKKGLQELAKKMLRADAEETRSIISRLDKDVDAAAIKEVEKIVEKEVEKVILEETAKVTAKETAEGVAKKIPVVGLLAGGIFGIGRLFSGDVDGAFMEFASGAASTIPGVGTAASVAIDVGIATRDIEETIGGLMASKRQFTTTAEIVKKIAEEKKHGEKNRAIVKNFLDNPDTNDLLGEDGMAFLGAMKYLFSVTMDVAGACGYDTTHACCTLDPSMVTLHTY